MKCHVCGTVIEADCEDCMKFLTCDIVMEVKVYPFFCRLFEEVKK